MRTFAKMLIYCSKLLPFSLFHFRLGKRLSHRHTHTHARANYNLWPCHILLSYFCGVSSYLFNFQDKLANQKTRLCKWPQQPLNVTTHIPGVHSLRHSSCWRSVNKNIVIIPAPLGSSALLPSPLFPSPHRSAPFHSPPILITSAFSFCSENSISVLYNVINRIRRLFPCITQGEKKITSGTPWTSLTIALLSWGK